jgi:diguanylate cyclase (GGDEF)-like protein
MRELSSLARLSNWPFALKMAFCPALAVLALLGMGLHGILAANEQAKLIHTVVYQDLTAATRLAQSAAKLQGINGALYRLTTLQASKTPGLDVGARTANLVAQTASVADDLQKQASTASSDSDHATLLRLAVDVRSYGDAIDVFSSMLEIDFTSAVSFFRPFDANANRVLSQLDAIAAHVIQEASSRSGASTRLAERLGLIDAGGAVAGALVLFGIAATLTRRTVASVKKIASATERVAKGSAQVDIHALRRDDELGTIVKSLAVFQANISQIAFLAHHDSLTRLPNRVLLHDRVQQALLQVDRGKGFAVLCLDLDRFKVVNDTLGHPVGDGLLRQVAERLQACAREGDTVARLGGDEFAIVLLNVDTPSEINALAMRVIEVVGLAYEVDGHLINIGTSIGMALAPLDGSSSHELLRNADTALYGAKANGRGTCCFFEADMNATLRSRRALELGLRQAILQEEFQLHYQPLVDAHLRQVTGFEALIRWYHPERGIVPPDQFISVAESCGLIGEIGRWVLHRACLDAASWPGRIKVAVNLSPLQFKDKHLVESVRAALKESGLPAGRLELEITESVLLHDSDAVLSILHRIKALGVQVSMDDFGTGYSSLSYLRSFPFDKIKIDRSFIKDLPHDKNSVAIVRAVVGLSATFGMSVVAEGVETDQQARILAQEDCTQLQGYLFSRPVPASDVPMLIERLSEPVERTMVM